MRIVRYLRRGEVRYGVLQGEDVYELAGDLFGECRIGPRVCAVAEVRLLAPVVPSKVVCVAVNYRHDPQDARLVLPQEPVIFLKPSTAVVGPEEDILYPEMSKRVHYEAELAVVIARLARRVQPTEALEYVLGYTCGNDVTAEDLQTREGHRTRAKSFDTFCPLGPCILTGGDAINRRIETRLNGEIKQSGSTSNLIFSVPELISFISQVMTLLPGDVILTGTPPGVGLMNVGDVVEVEIEGIGVLRNTLKVPS